MAVHNEIIRPRIDDWSYRAITLQNGLTALLVSDPEADKAAASMDVRILISLWKVMTWTFHALAQSERSWTTPTMSNPLHQEWYNVGVPCRSQIVRDRRGFCVMIFLPHVLKAGALSTSPPATSLSDFSPLALSSWRPLRACCHA
jgi:hypothetical protein